ncbi:hypothetical protein [Streptomyces qinzhouensis]|uniref:Uncharacterized protein n=1 Tax=Streptomyces qinzhouensis TaxID=2599401 RepID=A0A5B8JH78_9ACTN|nr:hypothetical protein [Streptomyces qinzhouensis]QDY77150.1 hypothetical protein FQU76_12205 [Streptomyces qinzhouensis]
MEPVNLPRAACRRGRAALAVCALAAALLTPAAPAAAQPWDVECDDQWHFDQVGEPIHERVVADKFVFDNRAGNADLKRTETVKESLTRTYSHSMEVGLEVTAAFKAFFAEMNTTLTTRYSFNMTQTNSVERETQVTYKVKPGLGFTYYVGLDIMKVSGYYERIVGCDTAAQRYQRVGPVTVEVPGVGKADWAVALPPLEAKK